MQDYRSLHAVVMIYATLVTDTSRQTAFDQLI